MKEGLARSRLLVVLAPIVMSVLGAAAAFGAGYEEARSVEVSRCSAIDPAAYQSGLAFNPAGYRSFYVRSECFQNVAVQFRDEALCGQVKQRRSLFSSSWGYSRSRCTQLVREGQATDRSALEETKRLYLQGGMRLLDFRIERNGNGRDFDMIPSFTGDYAHGYQLTVEILQANQSRPPAVIHSSGYYVDRNANLRIFIPQTDIRQRLPDFAVGRPYVVQATVTLGVGFGGQSGFLSDGFIARVFPVAERSKSLTKEHSF